MVKGMLPYRYYAGMSDADWVAVDVETATSREHSICALRIAYTRSDGTVGSRTWLVRPPGNRYNPGNSGLHSLTAADTAQAAAFPQVWAEALEVIAGADFVAHNAEFDIGCIQASMRYYEQPAPALKPVGCTLRMAHLVWPRRITSYRLATLCADLGIPHEPHDAASDAAAALILARVMQTTWGKGDLHQLRAASNRGYAERAESARARLSRHSTNPPSSKQMQLISTLLQERGIHAPKTTRLITTSGQASRAITAIMSERVDQRSPHYSPKRHRQRIMSQLHRIIHDQRNPDAHDTDKNEPVTQHQLDHLRSALTPLNLTADSIDSALIRITTSRQASRLTAVLISQPPVAQETPQKHEKWLKHTVENITGRR